MTKLKIETYIMQSIAAIMNSKNGRDEELKLLEQIINNIWELSGVIDARLIDYNLLFEVHNFFEENRDKFSLYTENREVVFNLKDNTIVIIKDEEKKGTIYLSDDEISDELYDFITEFYFNKKFEIDLSKLNEKTEVERLPELEME
jgi:hypothetical protein